ncbi:hypothetical protein NCG89_00890 [Spongiibacter taiwanensis]|uniref:hypothetical protein n=1 Tax=Spongiibacter taiwanensis TaxID=1748242 RepID=UPI00203535AA|nr:hypothetical protein [Spongiibacter taiwanensis]USA43359.1 hypothetical protein NCG89_00890 [Spongiibacter taiwanensis]
MQIVKTRAEASAKKPTTFPDSDKVSLLNHKVAMLVEEIDRLEDTKNYLLRRLAKAEDIANKLRGDEDVAMWFWQDNGEDHPESMVNSLTVVMTAGDLRREIHRQLAPMRALQHRATALAQAVEFYAHQAKYAGSWLGGDPFHVMEDGGRVARNALAFAEKGGVA